MVMITWWHLAIVGYLLAFVGALGPVPKFWARVPVMVVVVGLGFLLGPLPRKDEELEDMQGSGVDPDDRDTTRKNERPKRQWAITDMGGIAALNWVKWAAERSGASVEPSEPFDMWVARRKAERGNG